MSDSDSGPEIVECDDISRGAKLIYDKDSPFVALQPPEVIYERLNKIPMSVRKQAAQLMNVNAFWYHIMLLRLESHKTTRWAVQVGFIDANVSIDLSLKRLSRIEVLEAILRAMEKGCFVENQTRHLIWISNKFNLHSPEVLDDALHWLEKTREPLIRQSVQELGHKGIIYTTLQHIFTEYAHYVQAMGVNRKKLMRELSAPPSAWAIEKCEEMKSKGNDQFQKKKYEAALKFYSKAIKLYPENHVIYGNRALCHIRCEKYLKAVGDGKRAMLIQPSWAKGHYRFCEAMYGLGEHTRALEANAFAQTICHDDPEGIKDLQQQNTKFSSEIEERRLQDMTVPLDHPKQSHDPKLVYLPVKLDLPPTQLLKSSEMADKNNTKPIPYTPENKKTRKKDHQAKEKTVAHSSKENLRESLGPLVLDAHVALFDQRSRNAEQAFSQALCLLEISTPKELGISSLDVVLLIYGRASALTEIGQPEELAEALREYDKIKSYEQRKFQCLVYYGIGKVYLKENRFLKALGQFSDSLQMVKNQITPGKLTWPTTKETIRETQPDYLKELLQKAIEVCRFHPKPDATCCHENCHGHSKVEIYFTDPDFKGFIQIMCCQSCSIEYHVSCWKTLKASSFSDKNEKDFLQEMCFTPDCGGRICSIKIYDSTGLIKCKFEAPVIKSIGPIKLIEKQPCTNLRKLKAKEAQLDYTKGNPVAARVVCQQLQLGSLGQVVELLLERKNRVWARILVHCLSTSCSLEASSKLYDWANQLDSTGLSAAETFIERYAEPLEELDLAPLLAFAPLQDTLIEKFGVMPEAFFSRAGLPVTEYLKQAASLEVRLFIWTLEEHRDIGHTYASCHSVLDEYFEMMDGLCLVIRKPEYEYDNNSPNKNKNRNRKKKQKETMAIVSLSGMRGGVHREDCDQDFIDEADSLRYLESPDPFVVPNHLRNRVAEFEGQYNSGGHDLDHKAFLDNNSDPAKESLFAYFAQILESNGPLELEDPLLVGELVNFPLVARQKIQEAGGLKPFLLESLRFVLIGQRVGLMTQACVRDSSSGGLDSLDLIGDGDDDDDADRPYLYPSAQENTPGGRDGDVVATDYPQGRYPAQQLAVYTTLPCPYLYVPPHPPVLVMCPVLPPPPRDRWSGCGQPHRAGTAALNHSPFYSADLDDVDLYDSSGEEVEAEAEAVVSETAPPVRSPAKINAAVQGDLAKKQKSNIEFQKEIHQMKNDYGVVIQGRKESIATLGQELENLHHSIQITNKELVLFQQKLEEEVKKDQQEKKENQETLKTLKAEMKELTHSQESNQSAAEKMSLEDEIKRCTDLCVKAARRTQAAEALQTSSPLQLLPFPPPLHFQPPARPPLTFGAPEFIRGPVHPPQGLVWAPTTRSPVSFQRTGRASASPTPIMAGGPASAIPVRQRSPVQRAVTQPPPSAAAPTPPPARPSAPKSDNVFEKILDRLSTLFPHYKRPDLMKFVQEVRLSSGGALNSLSYEDVVNQAAQIILDQQDNNRPHFGGTSQRSDSPASVRSAGTPPPSHAWKNVGAHGRPPSKALNLEDPCIICHEDMCREDLCVLECRHSFHRECIRSWLREQSTCPTCREHALLPEDFPMLPGRMRRGHTPSPLS
ncbi:E3 ubiquitin-protein ligase TTC3 [Aplochiton taeniatus]